MKMKKTILHLVSIAAPLLIAAAASIAFPLSAVAGQTMVVEKNHSTRVSLGAPAASVIVANPEIADVQVIDSRTIYIVGKGFGSSGVTVTDHSGRAIFDGEILVTAAQHGGITVYKGLTPSLMVCSNICTAQEVTGNTAPTTSSPIISVAQAPASAPAPVMAPGAAMVAQ